ncbi:MAG: hypothetical protein ACFB50_10390 [Rubrobacteraceae bacterium]
MARSAGSVGFPSDAWFEALRAAVADDRELAIFGRWSTLSFALRVGEDRFLIRLKEGRIEAVVREPAEGRAASFTLAGTARDWNNFLQGWPPPFYNDLQALDTRVESFSIEGDRHAFVQHIRTIKRIFRIARLLGKPVG